MALISTGSGFSESTLDFDAFYDPGHLAASFSGQTFDIPPGSVVIGGSAVETPGLHLVVDDIISVRTLDNDVLILGGTGLDPTWDGYPTGGTITFLQTGAFGALPDFRAFGVSVSGTAFAAAARTSSTADDIALYRQMLPEDNDYVLLSSGSDVFNTGDGKDLVQDLGGDNVINAGAGDDVVFSGSGNDRVTGGNGNDLLIDLGGQNRIAGGAGRDLLGLGTGENRLTGGTGADIFVLGPGRDVVTDFDLGQDRIVMLGTATEFADLIISQVGQATRITLDDTTFVLQQVDAASLSAADFLFNDLARITEAWESFATGWDFMA